MAATVVLSGLAGIGYKAVVETPPPAAADSCSDCGESETELSFYSAAGGGITSAPYGQPVKMVALVSDRSGSCDIGDCNSPSGKVYFFDNGSTTAFGVSPEDPNDYTPDGSGGTFVNMSYPFTVSNLAVGAHSIRALYSSPAHSVSNPWKFDDSEDTEVLTITKATTSNALTASAASSTFGQSVTFTATVAPNPAVAANAAKPTGNVEFIDITNGGSGEVFATQPLDASGVASVQSSGRPVGTRKILAAYQGDANYNGHLSNEFTLTVSQAATTTIVSSTPNPTQFGQTPTFTATVSPMAATGTVVFTIDGVPGSPVALSSGQANITPSGLGVGAHTFSAAYSGDTNFATSSSPTVTHTVTKADTVSTLASTPNPSVYGQGVNLTGTVSPATATGTVTFYDGGNPILTSLAPSPAGSTSALRVGTHSLTFSYAGDASHNASSSNTVTHVVNKANTSIALTGPNGPVDFGSSVPITATVSAVAPGAGTPTGLITLYEGSTNYGSVTLSGGQASWTVPELLPGTHNLTALYSGDGNFNGSTSSTPLAITLTCQNNVTTASSGTVTADKFESTCVTASVGTLVVPEGARVFINGASIRTLSANGADRIAVCGSSLTGSVLILYSDGPVLVGGNQNGQCAGNTTFGSVTVSYNRGKVQVADNTMRGLSATGNRGGITVANNQFSGALSCSSNVPAPTNGGRPNQGGTRSGQCAGL